MAGRVSVVTGATSGIGREVAVGLAALGSHVVVVGRGTDRARAAAQEIAGRTGNPAVSSVGVTDLALLSETRKLAETLRTEFPRIHVLVNNAGAVFRRRQVTSEGHERTFALNVLSPYLLTSVLVPTLVESAPSRVVNIDSAAHQGRTVDFDHLENDHQYGSGYGPYGVSKLELLLLTREMAQRLTGSGVTMNAVHPGFVRSGFAKNNGGGTALVVSILGLLFGRSVRRGADTAIYVASDPSLTTTTGQYFADRAVRPGSAPSRDSVAARRLCEACQRITDAPTTPVFTGSPTRAG